MNNIKKENSSNLHQPHRILQRNSNVSLQLSSRRQANRTKMNDGIRFLGAHNEITSKPTDKKPYQVNKQQFIEILPQDQPPTIPLTYDELVTTEACPLPPAKKIPQVSEEPKLHMALTKRIHDRVGEFAEAKDNIKEMETRIYSIRQTINSMPGNNYTMIREMLNRAKPIKVARTQTEPAQSPSTSFIKIIKQPRPKQENQEKQKSEDGKGSIVAAFVTQQPEPIRLLHCSSQNNLRSPKNGLVQKSFRYYISTILSAFTDEANTTWMQLCRAHLSNCLKQLAAAKELIKPVQNQIPPIKQLPKAYKKHTLVFDLDQTLVHCNQKPDLPHDAQLVLKFPKGEPARVGINLRPYAMQCLRQLSELYQIIVFTASHEIYGNAVADYLDPTNQLVSHRFFRQSCFKTADGYIKDLRLIDRSLDNMLLIDNAAYSYAFQLANGVPIIPFYDDRTDMELKHLTTYLKSIHNCDNIRLEHSRHLRCNQFGQFIDPIELLNKLYDCRVKY